MNSPSVEGVKRLADRYANIADDEGIFAAQARARAVLFAAIDALAAQSAGHVCAPSGVPLLQVFDEMIASIEVIDGDACWDHARMYELRHALVAQSAGQEPPLIPTPEMVDAGAQRLVSWEDNCTWPDSWSPLQVAAARNEAEQVWRSMWLAASAANGAAAAEIGKVMP